MCGRPPSAVLLHVGGLDVLDGAEEVGRGDDTPERRVLQPRPNGPRPDEAHASEPQALLLGEQRIVWGAAPVHKVDFVHPTLGLTSNGGAPPLQPGVQRIRPVYRPRGRREVVKHWGVHKPYEMPHTFSKNCPRCLDLGVQGPHEVLLAVVYRRVRDGQHGDVVTPAGEVGGKGQPGSLELRERGLAEGVKVAHDDDGGRGSGALGGTADPREEGGRDMKEGERSNHPQRPPSRSRHLQIILTDRETDEEQRERKKTDVLVLDVS